MSAPPWVEVTEWHICDGSRPSSGPASDQANWWARPVPATTTDRSDEGARRGGRIRRESHRVTDTEPGGPPPQEHRNDTHRSVGLDRASGPVRRTGLHAQNRSLRSVHVRSCTRSAVRSGSQNGSRFVILII